MITIRELINNELIQSGETKEFEYKGHIFEFHNYSYSSLVLKDMTYAGLRGKTVNILKFNFNNIDSYNEILEYRDFEEFFSLITEYTDIKSYSICSDSEKINCYLSIIKASRFLAKDLSIYKPLKEEPQKWTIPHVIRAIINKQYEYLKCNGYYTDDYAYDAAVNFHKGDLNNVNFAKKIIESPSGWWCSKKSCEGVVNICCHTFDCNSFKFRLV